MGVFDSLDPRQPTAEEGAMRVRQMLAQAFQQIESSLEMVNMTCDRHGVQEVRSALGSDAQEVLRLYNALKRVVEEHKPNAKIREPLLN